MQIETDKNKIQKKETVAKVKKEHKVWLGTYIILALICLGVYLMARLNIGDLFLNRIAFLQKGCLAGFLFLSFSLYPNMRKVS